MTYVIYLVLFNNLILTVLKCVKCTCFSASSCSSIPKISIYLYFVKFYIRFTSEDIEEVVGIIALSFGSSVATSVSCVSVLVAATERHS